MTAGRVGGYRVTCADGSVIVPAPVAEPLLRFLTVGLTNARRGNGGGNLTSDVLAILAALQVAAMRVDEGRSSANGTGIAGSGIVGDSSIWVARGDEITVTAAARRLGLTTRAVRKACAENRLRARKFGRQWLIHGDDLESYRFTEDGS